MRPRREAFGYVGDAIDADVDYGGAGPDVIRGDVGGAADGGDQDVGLAAHLGQVPGARVADGDGGVLVQQHQCHGLADDVAAAQDYGVLAGHGDLIELQHFDNAGGRAGARRGAARDQVADVDGMKAVGVFIGGYGFEDAARVDVFGEGHLD